MSDFDLAFVFVYVVVALTSPIWLAVLLMYLIQNRKNKSDNAKE